MKLQFLILLAAANTLVDGKLQKTKRSSIVLNGTSIAKNTTSNTGPLFTNVTSPISNSTFIIPTKPSSNNTNTIPLLIPAKNNTVPVNNTGLLQPLIPATGPGSSVPAQKISPLLTNNTTNSPVTSNFTIIVNTTAPFFKPPPTPFSNITTISNNTTGLLPGSNINGTSSILPLPASSSFIVAVVDNSGGGVIGFLSNSYTLVSGFTIGPIGSALIIASPFPLSPSASSGRSSLRALNAPGQPFLSVAKSTTFGPFKNATMNMLSGCQKDPKDNPTFLLKSDAFGGSTNCESNVWRVNSSPDLKGRFPLIAQIPSVDGSTVTPSTFSFDPMYIGIVPIGAPAFGVSTLSLFLTPVINNVTPLLVPFAFNGTTPIPNNQTAPKLTPITNSTQSTPLLIPIANNTGPLIIKSPPSFGSSNSTLNTTAGNPVNSSGGIIILGPSVPKLTPITNSTQSAPLLIPIANNTGPLIIKSPPFFGSSNSTLNTTAGNPVNSSGGIIILGPSVPKLTPITNSTQSAPLLIPIANNTGPLIIKSPPFFNNGSSSNLNITNIPNTNSTPILTPPPLNKAPTGPIFNQSLPLIINSNSTTNATHPNSFKNAK